MFGADDRVRDIDRLLHGKSIEMPAVPVPIEQRSLLSAVERLEYVTLDDLMNALVQGFAAARDSVFAIDSAWLKLAELRRMLAESIAVQQRCPELIGAEVIVLTAFFKRSHATEPSIVSA